MGLKDKLVLKRRERSLRRNIYNQLREEAPTQLGFGKKMSLMRKAKSKYINSSK